MLGTGQGQRMNQEQTQQQRLSPRQIQYIKLLQLPTIAFEQRIKEEMDANPVLEVADPDYEENESDRLSEDEWEHRSDDVDPVDQNDEVDWDDFDISSEYEGSNYDFNSDGGGGNQDWRDLPNPYHENQLEELEQQVSLLSLNDEEKLIATQILGSLDSDGYFRRDPEAVVDSIAFNEGVLTKIEEVEQVRKRIQQLDPPGIASRDLKDCLYVQLERMNDGAPGRNLAMEIISDYWKNFEKKHFSAIKNKLDINDEELKQAFDCIRKLDPKPGGSGNAVDDNRNYIEPDFEVYYEEPDTTNNGKGGEGSFVISMNNQNVPVLKISPHYQQMWQELEKSKDGSRQKETKTFLKNKIDSAHWFINSIRQRQNTLMNTMKTIVALQENFFKRGKGLKPMILKDIAERVNLDVSTISRVVNGKYVQTKFGVFELKYFFSEGIETESGERVSSREVKKDLQNIIDKEDKQNPLSDKAITQRLKEQGYKVARRTVSKYREQLNIPIARLRKQIP